MRIIQALLELELAGRLKLRPDSISPLSSPNTETGSWARRTPLLELTFMPTQQHADI
jgi:hypothetical protein